MKKTNYLTILIFIIFLSSLKADVLVKKCINGNAEQCNKVAFSLYMLELKNKEYRDFSQAINYYKKSCKMGYAKACSSIGHQYLTGIGVKNSGEKAINYYKKAYNLGDTQGYAHIGFMYLKGNLVKKDINKAGEYFKIGCEKKDDTSCLQLNLKDKQNTKEEDIKQIKKLKILCTDKISLSSITNCQMLANLYQKHNDLNNAIKIYKKGCNSTSQRSCSSLGKLYLENESLDKNYIKGIDYLKIGCSNGKYKDCLAIADFFKENLPVNTRDIISKKYYQKTCKLGYINACDK